MGRYISFRLLSPPISADLPTLPLFCAGVNQEVRAMPYECFFIALCSNQLLDVKERYVVSSSKIMVVPMVNKYFSTNLPIFYRILHYLETINYTFSNHYFYNSMPMTFYSLLVPQVKAS